MRVGLKHLVLERAGLERVAVLLLAERKVSRERKVRKGRNTPRNRRRTRRRWHSSRLPSCSCSTSSRRRLQGPISSHSPDQQQKQLTVGTRIKIVALLATHLAFGVIVLAQRGGPIPRVPVRNESFELLEFKLELVFAVNLALDETFEFGDLLLASAAAHPRRERERGGRTSCLSALTSR